MIESLENTQPKHGVGSWDFLETWGCFPWMFPKIHDGRYERKKISSLGWATRHDNTFWRLHYYADFSYVGWNPDNLKCWDCHSLRRKSHLRNHNWITGSPESGHLSGQDALRALGVIRHLLPQRPWKSIWRFHPQARPSEAVDSTLCKLILIPNTSLYLGLFPSMPFFPIISQAFSNY